MTEGQEMAAGGWGCRAPSPGRDERGTGKGHRWTGHGGGGGVTGCGQKVSATSLCPEDELDGFLLLHYPPSYSPDQQPALNPALGEHPESVCQITVCVNE